MRLKRMSLSLAFTALSLSAGLAYSAPAHAYTQYHRINATPSSYVISIFGHGAFRIQHTWANSYSYQDSFDLTESFSSGGNDVCTNASSATGCGSHYLGIDKAATGQTNEPSWFNTLNKYKNSSPGRYVVNGVCHQASNRATRSKVASTVRGLGAQGSVASEDAFSVCGRDLPYIGARRACP